MTVLIGVQAHPATGAAAQRQAQALAQFGCLSGIHSVNLQFARDWTPFTDQGAETLSVLEQDSLSVTGVSEGARKPIASEVCTVLAAEARRRNCEYFCFVNSDIVVTQAAVDEIDGGGRDGYAFSRMDVDPATGRDLSITLEGIDAFATRAVWWTTNAYRFRPFILGEPCWDSQYAGTMLRHSDGVILNVRPLIRHLAHERAWSHAGSFARYNGYLTALDARLFSRWCEYYAKRKAWGPRAGSAREEENYALQDAVFRRPWPPGSALMQAARSAKAWATFRRDRRRTIAGGHQSPTGTR